MTVLRETAPPSPVLRGAVDVPTAHSAPERSLPHDDAALSEEPRRPASSPYRIQILSVRLHASDAATAVPIDLQPDEQETTAAASGEEEVSDVHGADSAEVRDAADASTRRVSETEAALPVTLYSTDEEEASPVPLYVFTAEAPHLTALYAWEVEAPHPPRPSPPPAGDETAPLEQPAPLLACEAEASNSVLEDAVSPVEDTAVVVAPARADDEVVDDAAVEHPAPSLPLLYVTDAEDPHPQREPRSPQVEDARPHLEEVVGRESPAHTGAPPPTDTASASHANSELTMTPQRALPKAIFSRVEVFFGDPFTETSSKRTKSKKSAKSKKGT